VEMKELLKELRSMGKTILISSHILSELGDCCDGVGIMERGQLLAHGPIDAILRQMGERRDIEITVLKDPAEAERFLSHHPGIGGVAREAATVRFEFSGSDEDLAHVSQELMAREHRVIWVRENLPSLESVFMKVTKGQVQ